MTFTFTEAEPVIKGGKGREAEPNPFVEQVQSIALKLNKSDKPAALAFTVPNVTDDDKVAIRRYRRQLANAGLLTNPQVTVFSAVADGTKTLKNGHTEADPTVQVITFWTTKKILKPTKTETAEAATETADA